MSDLSRTWIKIIALYGENRKDMKECKVLKLLPCDSCPCCFQNLQCKICWKTTYFSFVETILWFSKRIKLYFLSFTCLFLYIALPWGYPIIPKHNHLGYTLIPESSGVDSALYLYLVVCIYIFILTFFLRHHNWVFFFSIYAIVYCYLEFKHLCLKNPKLYTIRVKKLF